MSRTPTDPRHMTNAEIERVIVAASDPGARMTAASIYRWRLAVAEQDRRAATPSEDHMKWWSGK